MKLFFDIETVKGVFKVNADDIAAPSNYKDATKIAEYQQAKIKELESKAGLNSFTAKICCISYAFSNDDPKYIIGINEVEVLKEFDALITKPNRFIGWNILAFDLPFIYHRAIKYQLKNLLRYLPKDNREFSCDVMKLVSPTDYRAMISLDSCCNYFGITSPKDGGIDGSKIQGLYDAGQLDKIGSYCNKDVEAMRQIYNLINGGI